MADVVLIPAGKTADGKHVYNVEQIVPEPELVVGGSKGDKHNTSNTVTDEFGIARPKRSWVYDLYGSIADRT